MSDNKKNPEVEEELDENIITLTDEETGEEQDFEIWAKATIDEKLYFALVPVEDDGEEYVILSATVDGEDLLFLFIVFLLCIKFYCQSLKPDLHISGIWNAIKLSSYCCINTVFLSLIGFQY